jgi:hypothetical protein
MGPASWSSSVQTIQLYRGKPKPVHEVSDRAGTPRNSHSPDRSNGQSRETRPQRNVRTPRGSGCLGCSRLSRLPPIAPGSPQPTSPFLTIVLPMFSARHRTLTPIRRLRSADSGVCASRSGGGMYDNRTLPEYSPQPACDGGGHCATAGTPTQNAAYACGV